MASSCIVARAAACCNSYGGAAIAATDHVKLSALQGASRGWALRAGRRRCGCGCRCAASTTPTAAGTGARMLGRRCSSRGAAVWLARTALMLRMAGASGHETQPLPISPHTVFWVQAAEPGHAAAVGRGWTAAHRPRHHNEGGQQGQRGRGSRAGAARWPAGTSACSTSWSGHVFIRNRCTLLPSFSLIRTCATATAWAGRWGGACGCWGAARPASPSRCTCRQVCG